MKRFVLRAALVLALALLCAEGLIRYRAWRRFGPYLDVYDFHERMGGSGLLRPRPGLSITFARRSRIETDSRGFRSPELALPKPPGTVRLAFLGASTTFCGQASSNERTWPALVTAGLAARHPELAFDHANAGVTSLCVADSLVSLRERVRAVEPDVLVVYHAANDLALDTAALARAQGLTVGSDERSWLGGVSVLWRLVEKNRRYQAAQRAARGGGGALVWEPDVLAHAFGERLRALLAEGRRTARLVVVPTFATAFRAEQPRAEQLARLEQSFSFMPYLSPEATLAGYAAYNDAIRAACAAEDALAVETALAIPGGEECFQDSVHLTERGCEAMAERVVLALEASAAFQRVLETARASVRDRGPPPG